MLNTGTFLFLYYFGYGFVIWLLWMCVADPSGRAVDPVVRRRLHRLARALAVGGVLHPAFALAGRDIGVQLGRAEGPPDSRVDRTLQLTNCGVVIAVGVLVVVVLSQLAPFEDVPVFRQIREGLPYD